MKKLLAIISFFFLLVIVGIIALPMMLPIEQIKTALEDGMTSATGREFKINGDVSAKILPNPAISVSDVTFANAEWGKADNMATLDKLEVRIALMPALTAHEVKVEKFVAHGLKLNLETGEGGKNNWTFETGNTGTEATKPETSSTETATAQTGDYKITLGDVGIRGGRLSITDLSTGDARVLENLDIALKLPALDQRAAIEGSATYQGEKMTFTLGVDNPQSLMDGKGIALDMDLTAGTLAEVAFKGDAMRSEKDIAKGKVSAKVPGIGKLVQWATGAAAPEGIPFNSASFDGEIALTPTLFSMNHATLALDDMKAKGTLSSTLGEGRPMIRADLATGHINVDRFIAASTSTDEAELGKKPKRTKTGWSKEDFPMPVLPPVDADITAKHDGLTYRTMEMGPGTLKIVLKDGRLTADMPDTTLQGGTVALTTTYGWKNIKTPQIGVKAKMAGVNVEPILKEFAEIDWVEGTGNATLDLTLEGTNTEDLMRTLSGKGKILFTDGELRRFNLWAIMEQLKQGSLNTRAGNEQHTVFDKLSGSFVIQSGALSNDDFSLIGPKVIANGKGRVLIVTQKYDYRVVPALLTDKQVTKTAPDGTQTVETVRVPGFEIPILIGGRFDDPKILPDFKAIVTKAVTDPNAMKEKIESLKGGNPAALIEGLMGKQPAQDNTATQDGSQTGTKEEPAPAKPRPEDLIKGLFGN